MIHKTNNGSRLRDNAPKGMRTTKCDQRVDNTKVVGLWSKVTCMGCLFKRVDSSNNNNKPKEGKK